LFKLSLWDLQILLELEEWTFKWRIVMGQINTSTFLTCPEQMLLLLRAVGNV